MPSSPVTAKLLGTPPATTVRGAEAAMMVNTSPGTPIRRAPSDSSAAGCCRASGAVERVVMGRILTSGCDLSHRCSAIARVVDCPRGHGP